MPEVSCYTLGNGLRLLCAPDRDSHVAAMAVTYGVGHRNEPEGAEGLAHLVEHLMFEGSTNYHRGEHMRELQARGGVCNAYTGRDYTQYFQIVSADLVPLTCELEADRMWTITVTPARIHRQLDAIGAEVATTVTHRPYGGFPDLHLASILFDRYENAHSGFVDNPALRDIGPAAVDDFHRRWYAPSNAMVSIVGSVVPEKFFAEAERTFGTIPPAPSPRTIDLHEPAPTTKRSVEVAHPFAPHAAVAVAFRVPDPAADLDHYLAHQAVASALVGDPVLGIKARLGYGDSTVGTVRAKLCDADPLESRHPAVLRIELYGTGSVCPEAETVVFEALRALAVDGADADRTRTLRGRMCAAQAEKLDSAINRAKLLGWLGLLHDRPQVLWGLPGRYGALAPLLIAEAAASLSTQPLRAVTVRPTEQL